MPKLDAPIWLPVSIVLAALILGLFNRYEISGAGTNAAYRVDRLTGKVAHCFGVCEAVADR